MVKATTDFNAPIFLISNKQVQLNFIMAYLAGSRSVKCSPLNDSRYVTYNTVAHHTVPRTLRYAITEAVILNFYSSLELGTIMPQRGHLEVALWGPCPRFKLEVPPPLP